MLLVSVIALVWLFFALAAVLLCASARKSDEEIARGA